MSPRKTLIFSLLFHSLCASAQEEPFLDPKNDPKNPLKYIPNKSLAVISALLYLAVAAGCVIWGFKRWGRYMLTIIIGCVCYAIGLFIRLPFASNTHQLGIYIFLNTITVLAPCGFIATVYMLLGRLALQLDADDYLLVKARIITKVFVTSDIVTLLIQASGGSMSTSEELSDIGTKIFLTGLIIQLISFVFYMGVFAVFIYRMKVNRPGECYLPRNKHEFFTHWTALAGSIAISCIGILIRSVFRTIELSEGYGGHLATTEGYFYALDTLPLFIGIAVFVVTWPPLYLTKYKHVKSTDVVMEMGTSRRVQK
ncbi:Protein RTA1 [Rhizoctonia solani AG-1 IB]|uniref:Protein RTA1 n=2 Tax=Thanatephorus cucumeris (strain AG1-IB / isolate 7/3/14) TaxID=1108050 RepID=M5CBD0_THACB|nr:Protein RTA1 [Rhizoctonia solani AG-1 IB]